MESTKEASESVKESAKAVSESVMESAKAASESVMESDKAVSESVMESAKADSESVNESDKTVSQSVMESAKAASESVMESDKTVSESVMEITKAASEKENQANELVEETSNAFNFTEDTDPFRARLNLSTSDWVKMALMAVTIVPIRIVALSTTVVFCWLTASIGLIGMDRTKPVTGWRLVLRKVVAAGGRTCCRCVGFYTVKITGTPVGREVAPVLVAAPHSSFFDGLALFFSGLPFMIGRVENLQIPFLGKLIEFSSAICVDRDDPDSRDNTVQEIIRRVNSDEPWPQLIIFPEGTTTNRKALMSFQRGGFIAGKPVQPVLIKYHNKIDTVTWTWDMPYGAATCFFLSLCQWRLYSELEYMAPYAPSQEEINDPNLFGANVRKYMAERLEVPLCDVTFQDLKAKYSNKKEETQ